MRDGIASGGTEGRAVSFGGCCSGEAAEFVNGCWTRSEVVPVPVDGRGWPKTLMMECTSRFSRKVWLSRLVVVPAVASAVVGAVLLLLELIVAVEAAARAVAFEDMLVRLRGGGGGGGGGGARYRSCGNVEARCALEGFERDVVVLVLVESRRKNQF